MLVQLIKNAASIVAAGIFEFTNRSFLDFYTNAGRAPIPLFADEVTKFSSFPHKVDFQDGRPKGQLIIKA
jgi:hypothetical protein